MVSGRSRAGGRVVGEVLRLLVVLVGTGKGFHLRPSALSQSLSLRVRVCGNRSESMEVGDIPSSECDAASGRWRRATRENEVGGEQARCNQWRQRQTVQLKQQRNIDPEPWTSPGGGQGKGSLQSG